MESTAKKDGALNRLQAIRGHVDGIIRMVQSEEYCVDAMKQISTIQCLPGRANRVMSHKHSGTYFGSRAQCCGQVHGADRSAGATQSHRGRRTS